MSRFAAKAIRRQNTNFRNNSLVSSAPGSRFCIVVTWHGSLRLAGGQHRFMIDNGFEVTAISSPRPKMADIRQEGAKTVAVAMDRQIAPLADMLSLWRLYNFFRRGRFDIVSVSTPKAGLLASLVARLAGQLRVVYTQRGMYYETMLRLKRAIFKRIDRLVCFLANECLMPPGGPEKLAQKIKAFIADRNLLAEMSRKNYAHALDYRLDITAAKKRAFWNCVIRETNAVKSARACS